MSAISLFGTAFSGANQIADKVAVLTGYRIVTDRELIKAAASQGGIGERELEKVVCRRQRFMDMPSRKKALAIAALKLVLAEFLEKEPCIFLGFAGHLVPRRLALRIFVGAGMELRLQRVFKKTGKVDKSALQYLRREDERLFTWTRYMQEKGDCGSRVYDAVIPADKADLSVSASEIVSSLADRPDILSDELKPAMADFVLAARVAFVLACKGYDVPVAAREGNLTLTINRHVVMLSALERKLKKAVLDVHGVDSVKVKIGKRYYRANICHGYRYRMSSADIRAGYEKEYRKLYRSAGAHCVRPMRPSVPGV